MKKFFLSQFFYLRINTPHFLRINKDPLKKERSASIERLMSVNIAHWIPSCAKRGGGVEKELGGRLKREPEKNAK